MELIVDGQILRRFLSFLEETGTEKRLLNLGVLEIPLRKSSEPIAIAAKLVIGLMEDAAELAGRPAAGVQFAEWLDPHLFGPMALLGEGATTLAERFHLACQFVHIRNNTLTFEKSEEQDNVIMHVVVHPAIRPIARQFTEFFVAHCVKNVRTLLGAGWNAIRVELAHGPRASAGTEARYFKCPIRYLSGRDAIVVSRSDFVRRLPQSNPEKIAMLKRHFAQEEPMWRMDLRTQVEHLVASQLSTGTVSLTTISALLAMSPRTLQRRLAASGSDFAGVLEFVRIQAAEKYLRQDPPPPLTRLSQLLGYSDASVASRFVKSRLGQCPRKLARRLSAHQQSIKRAARQTSFFTTDTFLTERHST
ncbi:AraC family transcriptional regulator [Bradyrhizobium vignae]|uniref:AraC family transcriptional regulator n=1 Tax=Bradyrhizobium vignae TaxID=1549949 RepID=UPI00100B8A34|nr:AraC family transcriptional regulator [Bradyrhizobium vignae]RXH06693.1 AraC family transcriptional regulator [Bradyrhizobium vignae]